MNQVVIVGRLVETPTITEKGDRKVSFITLAVPRNYKNINGEYDTDFISCVLWNVIAENTVDYCHKGDLVAVKGRLQKLANDNEMIVVSEKITFLSNKMED